MGQVLSLPKPEHNLLCFSLAEEEIKTEQEVVEGMDISTRSKGECKKSRYFLIQIRGGN